MATFWALAGSGKPNMKLNLPGYLLVDVIICFAFWSIILNSLNQSFTSTTSVDDGANLPTCLATLLPVDYVLTASSFFVATNARPKLGGFSFTTYPLTCTKSNELVIPV